MAGFLIASGSLGGERNNLGEERGRCFVYSSSLNRPVSVCLSVCLSCLSAWVDYLTECLCVRASLHCGVMTAGCGTGLTGQT